jgi:hypothetical protein
MLDYQATIYWKGKLKTVKSGEYISDYKINHKVEYKIKKPMVFKIFLSKTILCWYIYLIGYFFKIKFYYFLQEHDPSRR